MKERRKYIVRGKNFIVVGFSIGINSGYWRSIEYGGTNECGYGLVDSVLYVIVVLVVVVVLGIG